MGPDDGWCGSCENFSEGFLCASSPGAAMGAQHWAFSPTVGSDLLSPTPAYCLDKLSAQITLR